MPVPIRPGGPDDIPAITRIYAHAVRGGTASFEIEAPDEHEMARRQRALLDGGFPYLVAEAAGGVVGYAYAGPYRLRPAYRLSVEDSIYVAAGSQRQGVGRTLLEALIAEAEARNFRQMIAVIGDPDRQTPSVTLHRLAGFAIVGTLRAVGYKQGAWRDTLLMQRALGAGATAPP